MTMVNPAWSPPDELDEYRIVRLLGRGAMGQVYLAHDSLLDRHVALKFVRTDREGARAEFLEEARAIARLQHPNVVAIYRVAEIARQPYLVSEYVRGRTLDQLTRPVPWREVLDLAIDLTRGLAAAHRRGVLHRDVKPQNAMLTDEGRAKLLDFGLARITDGLDEDFEAPSLRAEDRARAGHLAVVGGPEPRPGPRPGPEPAATTGERDEALEAATRLMLDSSSSGRDTLGLPRTCGPGTPRYMAPEIFRGEPATRRSDLYSLGLLLYELLAGEAPLRDMVGMQLGRATKDRDVPRLAELAPGVDPALAAIVDRLVERDPGARFASADALLVSLEELAAPVAPAELPDGNPYRGLAAFASAHGALFFGRRNEVRELVDRVRTEAFVVVAGDSGTGKSSLCRAGALPWLAEHDGWSCVDVVPGRHPARSLAAALAAWLGADEAELTALLREDPDVFARDLRRRVVVAPSSISRRLLLFVDQLEELLTLSEPEEARAVAAALAALAARTPSVRVLASCRSDFLSRVATLPGLADEMARGLYFLPPLAGERIREVIVRPAAAKGVTFESEALIDALVEQTEHAPGGLPLLSFTLAELWDARDVEARTIRAASLDALGGVGGALTRHADRLLASLGADERDAARRILLRLVTDEGTRARRPEAELLTGEPEREVERRALEVLVHGRILVANDAQNGAYEIAHEALLSSWSTLQDWLQRDAADHAARARVEQAAAAWERMGRPRDLLWGRRQLDEVKGLVRDDLLPREAAFLAAGRTAIRRRWGLGASAAAVLAIGAVVVGLAIRSRARYQYESVVANQLREATTAHEAAREIAQRRDDTQRRAFERFTAQRWDEGEELWSQVEAMVSQEERQYRLASSHLESALQLAPTRDALRDAFAALTLERLVRAEQDHQRHLVDELAVRMVAYGGGGEQAQLGTGAELELDVLPAETEVWIEAPGAPRRLLGKAPLPPLTLPPGSVVLSFESYGHVTAQLPLLLARNKPLKLRVELPTAKRAYADMIYVPAGPFLFGSVDSSNMRRGFLNAAPAHEVQIGAYFIGRHEVTFAQWIEFLDDLSPEGRRLRTPNASDTKSSIALTGLGPNRWRLEIAPTTERTYTVETGQRLRYGRRKLREEQDWMKLPVAAVSYEDAVAFAAWLDRTGRIPGARLCNEYEWERAARGADARTFPTGDSISPADANIDATYERDPLGLGPDEVGSHPGSRSPVGAEDMAGNVWEFTESVQASGDRVIRGGSWFMAPPSVQSTNREPITATLRLPTVGVRLCAKPR